MAGSYLAALEAAKKSGQAGRVVPYGGTGQGIKYKFVPNKGKLWYEAGGSNVYSDLIADFQRREEEARQRNVAAESEVRGIHEGIVSQYEQGGAFRQAALDEIELGKQKALGAGTQANISGGLFGTTVQGALSTNVENQASRERVKLEDMLQQRVNTAKLGLSEFVERIQRPYPDYNLLVQAMIAKGQA